MFQNQYDYSLGPGSVLFPVYQDPMIQAHIDQLHEAVGSVPGLGHVPVPAAAGGPNPPDPPDHDDDGDEDDEEEPSDNDDDDRRRNRRSSRRRRPRDRRSQSNDRPMDVMVGVCFRGKS